MTPIIIILLVVVAIFILSGLKVINQYQRGVVLTLGRFTGVRGPGLRVIIPIFQKIIMVDVRSTPVDVPKQEMLTPSSIFVSSIPQKPYSKRQIISMQPANLPRQHYVTLLAMLISMICLPSAKR